MLVSATQSTSPPAVAIPLKGAGLTAANNPSTRADVNSSNGAASGNYAPVPSADQAAETIELQFRAVEGVSDMLNTIQSFIDQPKSIMFTDDEYTSYLSEMHKHMDILKASLACGIQGLKDRYNASGDFPSQRSDGTWSEGSFSGSIRTTDYALQADSSGGVSMSKNGGAFVKWPGQSASPATKGSLNANVALEVLKNMLKVNVEA